MGRPQKNNCDYFRHFTTMRNHRKVKALRNKFDKPNAPVGYAFWSMIMEYLTEADGNEMEDSEMELELFGGELGVSVTEIRSMVDFCVRMEMLFIVDGFIHSESLDEDLEFVYKKRKTAKDRSATRKRRKNGTFAQKVVSFDSNNQDTGITVTDTPNDLVNSVTENPQIRVDKINKEINKEKVFDQFRKLYPKRKRSLKTEFTNFKKKHKDWETVLPILEPNLSRQIEVRKRLEAKGEWLPDWKNLSTWINQRCWEEEIGSISTKLNGEIKHQDYVVDPKEFYGIK